MYCPQCGSLNAAPAPTSCLQCGAALPGLLSGFVKEDNSARNAAIVILIEAGFRILYAMMHWLVAKGGIGPGSISKVYGVMNVIDALITMGAYFVLGALSRNPWVRWVLIGVGVLKIVLMGFTWLIGMV